MRQITRAVPWLTVALVLVLFGAGLPVVHEHGGSTTGIYARCLSESKLDVVDREKADGHRVMVVGDGVNDALALDRADVGVAMGRWARTSL